MTISNGTGHPMHRVEAEPPLSQNYSCETATPETALPACGARTRGGSPCRNIAMKNGRCRMHGGASTGARTPAGLARVRTVGLIHGGRSREMIEFRRQMRQLRADARRMIEMA